MKRVISTLLFTTFFSLSHVYSQVSPGDIAFINWHADNNEGFAVLVLEDIPANTQITFTDRGWDEDNDVFWDSSNEGTILWTAPGTDVARGSVIEIDLSGPSTNIGTVGAEDMNLQNDDQILAYLANTPRPNFIAAVNWEGAYKAPASNVDDDDDTDLPTELTLGSSGLNFATTHNGRWDVANSTFLPLSGITCGSPAEYFVEIANPANWNRTNDDITEFNTADGVFFVATESNSLRTYEVSTAPESSSSTGVDALQAFQNTALTIPFANFPFMDDDMGDVLSNIIITTPPTLGDLFFDIVNQNDMPDGAAETFEMDESAIPILVDLGFMKYRSTNSSGTDSFGFKISDGCATSIEYTIEIEILGSTTINSIASATPNPTSASGGTVTFGLQFANDITALPEAALEIVTTGDFTSLVPAPSFQMGSFVELNDGGNPNNWTVVVENLGTTAEGTITINLTDGDGALGFGRQISNAPFNAGEVVTVDRTIPTVLSLEYVSNNSVRVTFSEPMSETAVESAALTTWDLENADATPMPFDFNVTGVDLINDTGEGGDNTQAIITVSENLNTDINVNNGDEIRLIVGTAAEDIAGNSVDQTNNNNEASFNIDTDPPQIVAFEYVDDNNDDKLRVTFDEEIQFTAPGDFILNIDIPATFTVSAAAFVPGTNNQQVELTTTTNIKVASDPGSGGLATNTGDIITVGTTANVTDLFTNPLDPPTPGADMVTIDEDALEVSTVAFEDDTHIRVSFNDVLTGDFLLTASYTVEHDDTGNSTFADNITVTGVTQSGMTDVLLEVEDLKSEILNMNLDHNDVIMVTVTGALQDDFDNNLTVNSGTFIFDELGPTVLSLSRVDDDEVLITFDSELDPAGATNLGNYTLLAGASIINLTGTPILGGVSNDEVTLQAASSLSGQITDGTTVLVAVNRATVLDLFNNGVENQNTATFVWDGAAPVITNVEYLDNDLDNQLLVTFSEDILFTGASDFDPLTFTGGAMGETLSITGVAYNGGNLDQLILTTMSPIKLVAGLIQDDVITVNPSGLTTLRDAFDNALGAPNLGDDQLTMDITGPTFTIEYVDNMHIRVLFGETIANGTGTITDFNTYTFAVDDADDATDAGDNNDFDDPLAFNATAAVLEANGQDVLLTVDDIDLTLDDLDDIILTIDNGDIQDLFDNNLQNPTATNIAGGLEGESNIIVIDEVAPEISIVPTPPALDDVNNQVTIFFTDNMNQSTVEDVANYNFTPSAGSVGTPSLATYDDLTQSVVIDIDLSGLQGNLDVEATAAVLDDFDNPINTNNNPFTINNTDMIRPSIIDVQFVNQNNLLVIISEDISAAPAWGNAANWSVTVGVGNSNPTSVGVSGNEVTLNRSGGFGITGMDMVVVTADNTANLLEDLAGNDIDVNTGGFTFDNTAPYITGVDFVNDGSDDKIVVHFNEAVNFMAFGDFGIDFDSNNDGFGEAFPSSVNAAESQMGGLDVQLTFNQSIKTTLTGTQNRIQVLPNANVVDIFGNNLAMPIPANADILDIDITAPFVETFEQVDDTRVRVIFSEEVLNADMSDTQYTIDFESGNDAAFDEGTVTVASINSSVVNMNKTEVILDVQSLSGIVALMEGYEVRVTVTVTGITDNFNNELILMSLPAMGNQETFFYDQTAPTVSGLEFVNGTQLKVVFSEPLSTGESQNLARYQLNRGSGGQLTITNASLTATDEVTLTIDPSPQPDLAGLLADGELVTVIVDQTSVIDLAGNFVASPNSAGFNFDNTPPRILSVEFIDDNTDQTLLVTFSEDVVFLNDANKENDFLDLSFTGAGVGAATLMISSATFNGINESEVVITAISSIKGVAGLATNDVVEVQTINANITDAFNNILVAPAAPADDEVVIDLTPPELQSISFVDNTSLLLTFSEDIQEASAGDIANNTTYTGQFDVLADNNFAAGSFTNSGGAIQASNEILVTVEPLGSVAGLDDGDQIRVTINAMRIQDDFNNNAIDNFPTLLFDQTAPTVLSDLVFVNDNDIRVQFDDMIDQALAEDASNYALSSSAGMITGNPLSVVATVVTNTPTGAEVSLTGFDLGGTPGGATITVVVSNVEDDFGNLVDGANNTGTLVFDASAPELIGAEVSLGVDTEIVLTFNDLISVTSGNFLDNFTFDIGMMGETPNGIAMGTTFPTSSVTVEFSAGIIQAGEQIRVLFSNIGSNIEDDFGNPLGTTDLIGDNNLFGPPTNLSVNCKVEGLNLTWTAPPGAFGTTWDGVIVVGSETAITYVPSGDGVDVLTGNTDFSVAPIGAGDDRILANLTVNADGDLDITGLNPGTNYFFRVYGYRDAGGLTPDDVTGTTDEQGVPTFLQNFTATGGANSVTLQWTAPPTDGCLDNMIIVARENALIESGINSGALAATLVPSTSYSGNPAFSSRSNTNDLFDITGVGNNDENYVVYQGPSSSGLTVITGLTNTLLYDFRAFLFDDTDGSVIEISQGVSDSATPYGAPTGFSTFAEQCAASNEISLSFSDPSGTIGDQWDGIVIYGKSVVGVEDISQTFTNLSNLRISSIDHAAGNNIDYTLDGGVDLSSLAVGDYLTVDGALNAVNNGIFQVTGVNDATDVITINNPLRSTPAENETATVNLMVDNITLISGTTVEYTFTGAPDFTTFVTVGDILQVFGSFPTVNDGNFTITEVNTSSLRVINSSRIPNDNGDDEVGSAAVATIFTATGRTGEDAPTNDGGSVFGMGDPGDNGASLVALVTSAGVGAVSISNVNTAETYDFVAYAFKDNGNVGDDLFSSPLSVTGVTPLGASNFVATGGNERIVLSWDNGPGDGTCAGQIVIIASQRDSGGDNEVDTDVDRGQLNGLGISYNANSVFGDENSDLHNLSSSFASFQSLIIDNDNYVVFNDDASDGLANSAVITGLTNDTEYHFALFYIGDVANQTVSQRLTVSTSPSGPRGTTEATSSTFTSISSLVTNPPGAAVYEITLNDDGVVEGDGLDMLVNGISITENNTQILNLALVLQGTFAAGEVITGVTSGATATIESVFGPQLTLTDVQGTFNVAGTELVRGQGSSTTVTANFGNTVTVTDATVFQIGDQIIGINTQTPVTISNIVGNDITYGGLPVVFGMGETVTDADLANANTNTITQETTYASRVNNWDDVIESATLISEGQLQYTGGGFVVSETILGLNSGATARITADMAGVFTLETVSGTFDVAETIEGLTSGATATVDNFTADFVVGTVSTMANRIDFTGFDTSSPSGFGFIADDNIANTTSKTYTLNIELKQNIDIGLDGSEFNFEVITSNINLDPASSDFERGTSISSDEYGGNFFINDAGIFSGNQVLALASPIGTFGDQGVDLTVTLLENNATVFYTVIDGSGGAPTPPTATEIINGQGFKTGSFVFTAGVGKQQTEQILGLNPSTPYYVFIFADDSDGNRSNVIATVPALQTTNPDLGDPVVNASVPAAGVQTTAISISASLSEVGSIDYIVYPSGDRSAVIDQPSGNDIVNGVDPIGLGVITFGTINITDPNIAFTEVISFLDPSTSYDVWIRAADDEPILTRNFTDPVQLNGAGEVTQTPGLPVVSATTDVFSVGNGVRITVPDIAGLCVGQFFPLDDIVIEEDFSSGDFDIGNDQTLILTLPSGFIFNTSASHRAFTETDGNLTNITNQDGLTGDLPFNVESNRLTVTVSVGSDTRFDEITITGLEVSTTQVGNFNLQRLPTAELGGTAIFDGIEGGNGRTFATFSSFQSPDPINTGNDFFLDFCQNSTVAIGDIAAVNGSTFEWYTDMALTTVQFAPNELEYNNTTLMGGPFTPGETVSRTVVQHDGTNLNPFVVNDVITGLTSGATATVAIVSVNTLQVINQVGTFQSGEQILNDNAGAPAQAGGIIPTFHTAEIGTDGLKSGVINALQLINVRGSWIIPGQTIIGETSGARATAGTFTSGRSITDLNGELGINSATANVVEYYVIDRDATSLCPSTAIKVTSESYLQPVVQITPNNALNSRNLTVGVENIVCLDETVFLNADNITSSLTVNFEWFRRTTSPENFFVIDVYNATSGLNEPIDLAVPTIDEAAFINFKPPVFDGTGVDESQYNQNQYAVIGSADFTLNDASTLTCQSEVATSPTSVIDITTRGVEQINFVQPTLLDYNTIDGSVVVLEARPNNVNDDDDVPTTAQNEQNFHSSNDPFFPVGGWSYNTNFTGNGLQTESPDDFNNGTTVWSPLGLTDATITYDIDNLTTGCTTSADLTFNISSFNVDAAVGVAASYCDDQTIVTGIVPALGDLQDNLDAGMATGVNVVLDGLGLQDTGMDITVSVSQVTPTSDNIVIDFGTTVVDAPTVDIGVGETGAQDFVVDFGGVIGVTGGGTTQLTITADLDLALQRTPGPNLSEDILNINLGAITSSGLPFLPDGISFVILFGVDEAMSRATISRTNVFNLYRFDPSAGYDVAQRLASQPDDIVIARTQNGASASSFTTTVNPLPEVLINNLADEFCIDDTEIRLGLSDFDGVNVTINGTAQSTAAVDAAGYEAFYFDGQREIEVLSVARQVGTYAMTYFSKAGTLSGGIIGDNSAATATVLTDFNNAGFGFFEALTFGGLTGTFDVGEIVTTNIMTPMDSVQIIDVGQVVRYTFNTDISALVSIGEELVVFRTAQSSNSGAFPIVGVGSLVPGTSYVDVLNSGWMTDEIPLASEGINTIVFNTDNSVILTMDAATGSGILANLQIGDQLQITGGGGSDPNEGTVLVESFNDNGSNIIINVINLNISDNTNDVTSNSPLVVNQFSRARAWAGTATSLGQVNSESVDFATLAMDYVTADPGVSTFTEEVAFRIVYTGSAGCVNTGGDEFTILPSPTAPMIVNNDPTFPVNFPDTGGPNPFQVFEFCVDDAAIALGGAFNIQISNVDLETKYNWFADNNNPVAPGFTADDASLLTSSANSSVITSAELFGGTPAAGVYEFEIVKVENRRSLPNTPIQTASFLGCEGESAYVRIIIHDVPGSPNIPDDGDDSHFDNTDNNSNVNIDQYFVYEFCEDEFNSLNNSDNVMAFGTIELRILDIPLSNVVENVANAFDNGVFVRGATSGAEARIESRFDLTNNLVINIATSGDPTVSSAVAGGGGLFANGETINIINSPGGAINGNGSATVELEYRWYRFAGGTPAARNAFITTLASQTILHTGPQADATNLRVDASGEMFGTNNFTNNPMNDPQYEYYIVSNTVDDSDNSDLNGGTFIGCTSQVTRLDVVIHPEPVALQDDIDPENFFVTDYFICRGQDLDAIQTPRLGDVVYRWYEDAGLTFQITTTDGLGREVTQADLAAAPTPALQFDNNTAGVYTYFVTQTTNDDTETGEIGSLFVGCESTVTQINITVYPDEPAPNFTARDLTLAEVSTQDNPGVEFDDDPLVTMPVPNALIDHRVSYCVGAIDPNFTFLAEDPDLVTPNTNGLRFNWRRSDAQGNDQGLITLSTDQAGDGSVATANELGIAALQVPTNQDFLSTYFLVNQETNFIAADNFETGVNTDVIFFENITGGPGNFVPGPIQVTGPTGSATITSFDGIGQTISLSGLTGNFLAGQTITQDLGGGNIVTADVVQFRNLVFDNGFSGCESPATLFEIVIYDIPLEPTADIFLAPLPSDPLGSLRTQATAVGVEATYIVCESQMLPTININGEILDKRMNDISASIVYNWYSDESLTNFLFSGQTADPTLLVPDEASAVTPTNPTPTIPANLSGALLAGEHNFFVTQTADINGTPAFAGCESDPVEVIILINPDPIEPTVTDRGSDTNLQPEAIPQVCVPNADFTAWDVAGRPDVGTDAQALNDLVPTIFVNNTQGSEARIRYYDEATVNTTGFDPLRPDLFAPLKEGTFGDPNFKPLLSQLTIGFDRASGTTSFFVYQIEGAIGSSTIGGDTFAGIGGDFLGCTSDPVQVDVIMVVASEAPSTNGERDVATGQDTFTFCIGDGVADFVLEITSPDPAGTYTWTSGVGLNLQTTTPVGDPRITFDELGAAGVNINTADEVPIFVTLTKDGCTSQPRQVNIKIGAIPNTTFSYTGLSQDLPFNFTAAPTGIGSAEDLITFATFDFGDGSTPISRSNAAGLAASDFIFQHSFAQAGVYFVSLTIGSNSDCSLQHVRRVPVLPVIPVTPTQPYSTNFDNPTTVQAVDIGNSVTTNLFVDGWVPDIRTLDDKGDENNSNSNFKGTRLDTAILNFNTWQFGTVAGTEISAANSGSNAWVTNLTGNAAIGERSWVFSPVFDLTALTRPLVKFNHIFDIQSRQDGVAVQYSLDNGVTWTVLGDFNPLTGENTGIGWYNADNIQGNPGNQGARQVGWGVTAGDSETQTVWTEARHKLDIIAPQDRGRIIFRIAYGANSTDSQEGVGIDDFEVRERERIVLIEQFSGAVDGDVTLHNQAIAERLDDPTLNNGDGIVITYQTDLNGPDNINSSNPADPNTRVVFYGVEEAPSSVLNGLTSISGGFETRELPWSTSDFDKNSLVDPTVDINLALDPAAAGDVVAVTVNLNFRDQSQLTEQSRLYIAVVETEVDVDATPLRNVLRRLLPDAAGSAIIAEDGSLVTSFSQTWQISRVNNADNLMVVAFIQDNQTKEIAQTVSVLVGDKDDNIVTGIEDEIERIDEEAITLYPNPADDEVFINFGQFLEEDFDWVIYNQVGAQINIGQVRSGEDGFSIDTSRLPSGLYFLRMGSDHQRFDHLKFIISH